MGLRRDREERSRGGGAERDREGERLGDGGRGGRDRGAGLNRSHPLTVPKTTTHPEACTYHWYLHHAYFGQVEPYVCQF
jgi:hypothetical protein